MDKSDGDAELRPKKKSGVKPSSTPKKKGNSKWIAFITIWTFVLSITFSVVSNRLAEGSSLITAVIVLLVIIAIGIMFDIIGIAVATADETPFHSLAARRVRSAKDAVFLIRNAEKVSSFCNDVVGDICGIVSGATGAALVTFILRTYPAREVVVTLVVTAIIASLTVGGKAVGKTLAMTQSNRIVHMAANVIHSVRSVGGLFRWRKGKKTAGKQQ